jgi:hypothetical protein
MSPRTSPCDCGDDDSVQAEGLTHLDLTFDTGIRQAQGGLAPDPPMQPTNGCEGPWSSISSCQ